LHLDLGKALIELPAESKSDAAEGVAVLAEGLRIDPANLQLRAEMERARTSLDRVAGRAAAAAPAVVVDPPALVGVAAEALMKAAAGNADEAAKSFDPRIFSARKQADEVRRAYIEVQLQGLLQRARSGQACPPVLEALGRLGEEDEKLEFTLYGFGAFMKAAHFQYYAGLVEATCHDQKNAAKRWSKVSKLGDAQPSPEAVFPLLAAWKLDPAAAQPKLAAALTTARAAREKAEAVSKTPLLYVESMLLYATGQKVSAMSGLAEVAAQSNDVMLRYLAQVGMREASGGNR
jgi:hypothetical protein